VSPRAQYYRLLVDDHTPVDPDDVAPLPADVHDHASLWRAALEAPDLHACGGADRVLLGYAPTALLPAAGSPPPRTSVTPRTSSATPASTPPRTSVTPRTSSAPPASTPSSSCAAKAARHRDNLYRSLLAARDLTLPDVASPRLLDDSRLHDADFTLALAGLRLGRPRRDIAAEALGFHAATVVPARSST
jgi:hypothetical protein